MVFIISDGVWSMAFRQYNCLTMLMVEQTFQNKQSCEDNYTSKGIMEIGVTSRRLTMMDDMKLDLDSKIDCDDCTMRVMQCQSRYEYWFNNWTSVPSMIVVFTTSDGYMY